MSPGHFKHVINIISSTNGKTFHRGVTLKKSKLRNFNSSCTGTAVIKHKRSLDLSIFKPLTKEGPEKEMAVLTKTSIVSTNFDTKSLSSSAAKRYTSSFLANFSFLLFLEMAVTSAPKASAKRMVLRSIPPIPGTSHFNFLPTLACKRCESLQLRKHKYAFHGNMVDLSWI